MINMIPACVQDARNNKVLRIGFVRPETIELMNKSKVVSLYNPATQKDEPVLAGEYNDEMAVSAINEASDKSSVLIMAEPKGSTTGANQFLGNKNVQDLAFLSELQDFIEKRHAEMPEGSYTTKLFKGGVNKMTKKVGEETIEAIVEAINGSTDQFVYECSDMIYHLIVLLTSKGLRIEDLARELKARHK
ncbi:MAG: phosphoribosyl-ATP diphosphatase [Paludibacteraceae bacterium]|nr:phosphoribosyl-ATP diphosphatase [Paludibacteraceae bacterium]